MHKKGKKRLSADTKIILSLMKKQPQTSYELCENTGLTYKTVHNERRSFLIEQGIIKNLPDRWELWNYEPLKEKIKQVMEQLRSEGFYCQSLNKISSIAGVTPEKAEPIAYQLAPELGVELGDENIKRDAAVLK